MLESIFGIGVIDQGLYSITPSMEIILDIFKANKRSGTTSDIGFKNLNQVLINTKLSVVSKNVQYPIYKKVTWINSYALLELS